MIKESELILNNDGSVYHLHLKPEDIAETIILVGDPKRVNTVSECFDSVDFSISNREFKSITGSYNKKQITVISTGIGTDNIDIVINELDALVNTDLKKREIKKEKRELKIIKIGTSGSLQKDLPLNSWLVSEKSLGIDGLLNFYADIDRHCDLSFQKAFKEFTGWIDSLPDPYVVDASEELISKFSETEFYRGVTIAAPGFYGPQGRIIRLTIAMEKMNTLIGQFRYKNFKITNFEMESSAVYGLSRMLGHKALNVSLIIANRVTGEANNNYYPEMKKLIQRVLDILTV